MFFIPVLPHNHAFTIRDAIEGIDLIEGIGWFIVIVSAIARLVGRDGRGTEKRGGPSIGPPQKDDGLNLLFHNQFAYTVHIVADNAYIVCALAQAGDVHLLVAVGGAFQSLGGHGTAVDVDNRDGDASVDTCHIDANHIVGGVGVDGAFEILVGVVDSGALTSGDNHLGAGPIAVPVQAAEGTDTEPIGEVGYKIGDERMGVGDKDGAENLVGGIALATILDFPELVVIAGYPGQLDSIAMDFGIHSTDSTAEECAEFNRLGEIAHH